MPLSPESASAQDIAFMQMALHRALAQPLREDALRTPERCFEGLTDAWPAHYVDDLPGIEGLRLHYIDRGPDDSPTVYMCLHPVPGWSYDYQPYITGWLEAGARVVAPDLIGFGRSDKPKREDFHTLAIHQQYILAWVRQLDLRGIVLVVPYAQHWLAQHLLSVAPDRIRQVLVQRAGVGTSAALQAPYPDAGHRAAERAFAKFGLSETGMEP